MQTIKRLFLQSKPIYITLLIISGAFSVASVFISVKGLNIAISISFFLSIFFLLQVNHLVTHCFPMSLAMGEIRKNSIKNIFFFTLILAISLSILINLILILSSQISIATSIVPYLMGYNWNVIDGILLKFITILLLLSVLSGSIMWFTSGFKVDGFFNGISRILVMLIFTFGGLSLITNYIIWGRNLLLINIMFLLVAFLTHYLSYRTLIRYEFK